MAKNVQLKLTTYDDPEALARKACQHHEENDGPPMTHKDALLAVGMSDPLQINDAVAIMRNLTAENGEFHHLTVEKKYVETSPKAAEARQVPCGRSVIKLTDRKIKAVDDAKAKIARMENIPAEFKETSHAWGHAIVEGAGRQQNIDRTGEFIELGKEMAAIFDKHLRKETQRADREKERADRAEAEVLFLRQALSQALGGAGAVAQSAPSRSVVTNAPN